MIEGGQGSGPKPSGKKQPDYDLSDWNPTTLKGKIFGPSILPGADWVTKKITGESQEGGMGSGRKKIQPHGPKLSDLPPVKTPRAKPAMPATQKRTAYAESSGSNWGGEERPLTMTEADKMIQEMKATPMTGSTKRMSGGSKGKAPKHWTPVDFNVLAKGQDEVPVPVGRAVKEICEVCGVPNNVHENQDHPMIPPMASNFPPSEPSPQMPSPQPAPQEGLYGDLGSAAEPAFDKMFGKTPPQPQEQMPPIPNNISPMPNEVPPMPPPQEQDPFPMPNGMPDMPPAQIPPPMPQEQIPPIPTQNQEPQMQMQYTVSVPNSLSAQSIGGKKINEMIREIERFIK